MKFPRWICINCGQPSGRRYNIQRHMSIRHNGIGAFVSFSDYLAGRQTGIYQPSSAPTYHSRTNHLDIFMQEVHKELARKLVNQNFPPRPTWNQNQYGYNSVSSSSNSTSNTQPSTIDSNDILGYRGHVCKNCLEANIEEIHLAAVNEKGIAERKHICEPKKLAESYLYNNTDKSFRLKEMERKLPLDIRNILVNNWTKNQNYLVATKLPNQEEIEKNIGQNYIDLTLTNDNNNNNNNYWPIRAVKNSHILLSENEFIDFMRKVRNATFAIFKINIEGSVHFYAMAITNIPVRPSTFS
jgi:hypothetical protein